jgi:hypothetical protein
MVIGPSTTGPSWTRSLAEPSVLLRRDLIVTNSFWWSDNSCSWCTGWSSSSGGYIQLYRQGPSWKPSIANGYFPLAAGDKNSALQRGREVFFPYISGGARSAARSDSPPTTASPNWTRNRFQPCLSSLEKRPLFVMGYSPPSRDLLQSRPQWTLTRAMRNLTASPLYQKAQDPAYEPFKARRRGVPKALEAGALCFATGTADSLCGPN